MSKRITLQDIGASDCHFVIGQPCGINTLYCGDHVKPGSPYCSTHHALCYRAGTRLTKAGINDYRFFITEPDKPERTYHVFRKEDLRYLL